MRINVLTSGRRHTRSYGDWSSDVCSSDLARLERVELEHVIPEDLLLARVAQRQREEAVHGLRVLRVAVGIVRGGDQVLVAEGVDDVLHELLVALQDRKSVV